jgi:hypothetical protein
MDRRERWSDFPADVRRELIYAAVADFIWTHQSEFISNVTEIVANDLLL